MSTLRRRRPSVAVVSLVALALFAGCQTVRTKYYNAWENFGGYAKRERLVDNVKAAAAEQNEAKEQFATALEQFKSIVNFDGGNLEKVYNKLNDEYENCVDAADDVNGKIKSVKNVASSLFNEWQGEVNQIVDASLKSKSQALFDKTQVSYNEMIARMDSAAGTMSPVLQSFKDRVLFIKGNLNAQAIASLKGTELELGNEIDNLIKQMEASIKEADAFIAEVSPATN
jgi:ElaB/YqjD/DUF883 family membrane-anchored ribosome-binding protein